MDSNPNIWDLNPFINDLEALLEKPLNYIILNFPFAYLHIKTSKYIDLTVYIDTPLDIALLRKIKRDFKNSTVEEIISDLDHYQEIARLGYLNMLRTIKPNSDLIVDGTLPISKITEIIIQTIREIE
ncbi:hypothetical protein JTF06_02835 [Desemzia sp. RIT804]|uniref:hypothetical protein n=1 Tax=Desemzia sp. RIT 804 TaxID=2810209 RepID=UPI0019511917|nr:hypothetical protein [Desemzia sp. RIT 804]MBM6613829.1 hypothetical protein [Desemzia sp. RIT 804]